MQASQSNKIKSCQPYECGRPNTIELYLNFSAFVRIGLNLPDLKYLAS